MFIVQIEDANEVKNQEIAKELSLPPVKLHCSSKLGGCNQRIMKKKLHDQLALFKTFKDSYCYL